MSTLSRFLSGKTDKLGDENIIRIAHLFNVSTDFLLGVTNISDRENYDIEELGLSAQAARNLYTGKADARVVNRLLENNNFLKVTALIKAIRLLPLNSLPTRFQVRLPERRMSTQTS